MLVRRIHPALSVGARALSSFSSDTATATATATLANNADQTSDDSVGGGGKGTLRRRLLDLTYDKRSAVAVLTQWSREGKRIQKYQLNRIVRELRKYKRYKHALQICEWMTVQPDMKLLQGDYAVHLDLVAKIRGLASAEKFFEDMPERMKGPFTCTALLHTYVQFQLQEKAEALMKEMLHNGFVTCPIPFNDMLTLYLSSGDFNKIPKLVSNMRRYVLPDVITYNLWLTSCSRKDDYKGAEKAYLEMKWGRIIPDWYTFSLLASIYIKSGDESKAREALVEMEKQSSRKQRVAYSSMISLYASLLDRENIDRIWSQMRSLYRKLSDEEYKCMLTSLTKLGDIKEAELLYTEWELVSGTHDSTVLNIILSSYINNGMINKAEKFVERILQKEIMPCYSTWELLCKSYLNKKNIQKVLEYFKKALSSVKKWDPNVKLVQQIHALIIEIGDIEACEKVMLILREAGYVKTEVYNLLLQVYKKAGKMPMNVEERMARDRVSMDEETKRLLNSVCNNCDSEDLSQ
ncbi:Pentatricopeptide repeat-containing protein [Rhynchospora pubera]|uniref:Pentatricopeptide repeat-containing protein n=1 Tax=Rhynchospora pubera TaxID=906938 RepID=A0AAV8FGJ6_9POAL|nr:Pentatricopeptide repeat-containing protein [Rhynchospora pubera]